MNRGISQQDVDEALREIDVLIDSIGDEIADTISGVTERGTPINGRLVVHGGLGYQVLGTADHPFFTIRSGFDAAEARAAEVASDGGQAMQFTETDLDSVRRQFRAQVGDDDLGDIREGLINRLSRGPLAVSLNADEEFVTGFEVSGKLFVFDEDIGPQEFYDEVQTVISAMWRGKEYLVNEYELRDQVDTDDIGPRGFE